MTRLLELLAQAKIDAGNSGIPEMSGQDLLANGLNLTYFLAGAIAVIVIIVAGLMYNTAAGDSGKIAKAKNLLTYAIIGLVIVLCAYAITAFVTGKLG